MVRAAKIDLKHMTIKHHFFGLNCEIDRDLSNYTNIGKALQDKGWQYTAINFLNQIHGNQVLVIDDKNKIHGKKNLPKADAIITNQKNLAIAVITADCAPIIIKDESARIIAAIHAGWRGAKLGVIKNAILEMKKLGAKLSQMQAFIGPMIHQKSYQISQEFYDDFIKGDQSNARFFIEDKALSFYLFDLVAFVENQLKQEGIGKIDNINIDTYINYKQFASYRKACHEGKKSGGRNISITMID